MKKKFKFTNASIKALSANPKDAKGTDLEVSDTEIVGLKCLSGKNGSLRFLLRYTHLNRKCSIALGRFPEVDVGAARRIASKYKLQLAEGVNPQDAKNPINTIQARAGISLPKGIEDKHKYMRDLYFNRYVGQEITTKHLISNREMFIDERDFVAVERTQLMNLEWDMKRELVNPVEMTVDGVTHIFCETVPHNSLEEALDMRARFDGWRINNCLKRLTDWSSWEDYWLTTRLTLPTGIRYQFLKGEDGKVLKTEDGQKIGEGSDGVLRRLFIRAYMQDCCGLDSSSVERKELAEWLTDNGYITTANEVRGAARALFVEGVVPVTDKAVKLLRLLLERFPEFEYQALFDPEQLDELTLRLNA